MTRFTRLTGNAVLALVVLIFVTARGAYKNGYHESNYNVHRKTMGESVRPSWDYNHLDQWPPLCQTGKRQSPISFENPSNSTVVTPSNIRPLTFSSFCTFFAQEADMKIVNHVNIMDVHFFTDGMDPGDLSQCTVNDPLVTNRKYHFHGLHLHSHSEHVFETIQQDGELHLEFATGDLTSRNVKILVVTILLKALSANARENTTSVRALRHILVDGTLPPPHAKTTCTLTEDISIESFLPQSRSYLAYDGSTTYPPCSENVRWVIFTSPVWISSLALNNLRRGMLEAMPRQFSQYGNTRPPQPQNGRSIYRFIDKTRENQKQKGKLKDVWNRTAAEIDTVAASVLSSPASDAMSAVPVSSSIPKVDGRSGESESTLHLSNCSSMPCNGTNTTTSLSGDGSQEGSTKRAQHAESMGAGPHGSSGGAGTGITNNISDERLKGQNLTEKIRREVGAFFNESNQNVTKPGAPTNATSAFDFIGKTSQTAVLTWERMREHPWGTGIALVCILAVLYIILKTCYRCRKPTYVAGVGSEELTSLIGPQKHKGYGTTRETI